MRCYECGWLIRYNGHISDCPRRPDLPKNLPELRDVSHPEAMRCNCSVWCSDEIDECWTEYGCHWAEPEPEEEEEK